MLKDRTACTTSTTKLPFWLKWFVSSVSHVEYSKFYLYHFMFARKYVVTLTSTIITTKLRIFEWKQQYFRLFLNRRFFDNFSMNLTLPSQTNSENLSATCLSEREGERFVKIVKSMRCIWISFAQFQVRQRDRESVFISLSVDSRQCTNIALL